MLVQLGLADQACILLVKRRIMHGGVFVDRKTGGKQLRVRLGFEIHVETVSISTDSLATHTQKLFLHGTTSRLFTIFRLML